MQDMNEAWLQCQVDQGMFSDEVAVTYPAHGTVVRSVFVPKSKVRGTPGQRGAVQVKVVHEAGKVLAILPTPMSGTVAITEQDLRR